MRLVAQDQLNVAGNAPGKLVGQSEDRVKRIHRQPVHPANNRAERFGRGSEQVHIRIERGLFPNRGLRMLRQLRGVLTAAAGPHKMGPQAARSPEFGDFHEKVGADTEADHRLARRQIRRNTPLLQRTDAFRRRGQHTGQIKHRVTAGVSTPAHIHAHALERRSMRVHHFQMIRQQIPGPVQRHRQIAFRRQQRHRIKQHTALQGRRRLGKQHLRRRRSRNPGIHMHRHRGQIQILHRRIEIRLRADGGAALPGPVRRVQTLTPQAVELKHKRILTPAQIPLRRCIEFLRGRIRQPLTNLPGTGAVALRLRAANEGKTTRRGVGQIQPVQRIRTIDRLNRNPLRRFHHQFFIKRNPAENLLGEAAPQRRIRSTEIRLQIQCRRKLLTHSLSPKILMCSSFFIFRNSLLSSFSFF